MKVKVMTFKKPKPRPAYKGKHRYEDLSDENLEGFMRWRFAYEQAVKNRIGVTQIIPIVNN